MNSDLNSCHREILSAVHQAHLASLIQLVKCFKRQSRNVIKRFFVFFVLGRLSFRRTCILVIIIVVIVFIVLNFLLKRFNRSWISDTFTVDFNEVCLGLILSLSNRLFALTQSQFSSQELSPILIELLDSIEGKSNVIFLLNALIFGSQRYKFDIDLKLFKDSRLELFSNFKFVSDCASNTFFVVDF